MAIIKKNFISTYQKNLTIKQFDKRKVCYFDIYVLTIQIPVVRIYGATFITITLASRGDCPFVALRSTDLTTVRRVWHGLHRGQKML